MENKKSRAEHWGEILREIGTLLMVFGPMYLKFDSRETGLALLIDASVWVLCGIIFVESGIELERRF